MIPLSKGWEVEIFGGIVFFRLLGIPRFLGPLNHNEIVYHSSFENGGGGGGSGLRIPNIIRHTL
jgi:hypothetical protein